MTVFRMGFDLTTADQRNVLSKLQWQNYKLLGYKGASGPNQLSVGVPVWFSVHFGDIFGNISIDYTPTYKVYVSHQGSIAIGTTLQMQSLSGAVTLGNALTFNPTGEFVSGGVSDVPADSIGLFNNCPGTTSQLTVGLAAQVNTPDGQKKFLPFCAFTLNPQNSIIMTPLENILLVAAQQHLQSGNVQANVAAPGCTFTFTSSNQKYSLMVVDGTFAITNELGTPSVTSVPPGIAVNIVNNK